MADWTKIKAEYVAQGTPYRKLAEKHGVSLRTLARRAKDESWQQLREDRVNKLATRWQQRSEKTALQNADREMDRMEAATAKLMRKVEQLLEIEDALAPRDLRSLSSTLLDVRTLLGIRDEADREEQQTRIEKMRAEIAALQEDKTEQNRIEVVWVSNPWDQEEEEHGNE